jgi:superfamily I DNA/RNA helicase
VYLFQDFVTEEKINGYKDSLEGKVKDEDEKKRPVDITKINEEINLLYVAVTRAKHKLLIPETLVPAVFAPKTSFIEILKIPKTPDVSGKLLKSPEELNQTIKQLKLI